MTNKKWYKVAELDQLPEGQVTTVTAGVISACLIHSQQFGYTAVDNRCPHQGGPLGEGQIGPLTDDKPDEEWVICPWHGYQYHPQTGAAPGGYDDTATPFPLEVREDSIVTEPEQMTEAIQAGLAADRPPIVEILTDPTQT